MPKSKSKRRTYQPPPKKRPKASPSWLGPSILTTMFLGVAVIVLNYMEVTDLLPGAPNNAYLFGGLGLIALGFGAATQWR